MNERLTPEEKLLRLIRNGKRSGSSLEEKPAIVGPALKSGVKSSAIFNPHRVILFLFIAACIYLVISFIHPRPGLRNINLANTTPGKALELKAPLQEEIRPFEFYQKGIEGRNVFSASPAAPAGSAEAPAAGPAGADLIKDINLVGIITGENPQAVIEDKKTQKTYYLTKGQFIGELQVEDIKEGKIIINYQGRRLEVYL